MNDLELAGFSQCFAISLCLRFTKLLVIPSTHPATHIHIHKIIKNRILRFRNRAKVWKLVLEHDQRYDATNRYIRENQWTRYSIYSTRVANITKGRERSRSQWWWKQENKGTYRNSGKREPLRMCYQFKLRMRLKTDLHNLVSFGTGYRHI